MSAVGETPRRRHPWIWYFAILAVLTVTAASIQFWYAKGRVLTLEKVLAAEEKWKAHGPASYDLKYTTRKGDVTDEYRVEVRKGKVISLICNGKPIEEERLYRYSTMPALLSFIEDFMRQDDEDAKAGKRRPFAFGDFHPVTGYVRRFAHGQNAANGIEIRGELIPVSDS
jgi:hypothetical protein